MNYFNPIAGVVNLHEKCHASCCRHLHHACDYSEPYSMSCQAMVHLICNVKQNDVAMERLPKYANCTEETMQAKEKLGLIISRWQKEINHPENRSEQTGAFAGKTCQPSDKENGL